MHCSVCIRSAPVYCIWVLYILTQPGGGCGAHFAVTFTDQLQHTAGESSCPDKTAHLYLVPKLKLVRNVITLPGPRTAGLVLFCYT